MCEFCPTYTVSYCYRQDSYYDVVYINTTNNTRYHLPAVNAKKGISTHLPGIVSLDCDIVSRSKECPTMLRCSPPDFGGQLQSCKEGNIVTGDLTDELHNYMDNMDNDLDLSLDRNMNDDSVGSDSNTFDIDSLTPTCPPLLILEAMEKSIICARAKNNPSPSSPLPPHPL